MKSDPLFIRAVLFDFDGTLTRPESLDLSPVKEAVGCPKDALLLEFIQALAHKSERDRALAALEAFEMKAAETAVPNAGAEDLVRHLRSRDIRLGIITRNGDRSIRRALQNFSRIGAADFDIIISRDHPVTPKPSGDGILLAAARLHLPVGEILVVGDYFLDVAAGRQAGAVTVLLHNPRLPGPPDVDCDFRIASLGQVKDIVRMGLALPAGKLPNDLLARFLTEFSVEDPSVLIKPGVGDDTAAVDVSAEEVLVLKSDPITFATDAIGRYAVLVNANDIATAGAEPRWFLSTLMFPVGTTAFGVRRVMAELGRVCRRWHITPCGGHTEITDAVTRPVITGMMAGTVRRRRIVDKRQIKSGDRILLTKAVAVEGTAIIARECAPRLKALGVSDKEIESCRRFLDRIGILEEARTAARLEGVSAMHDVTEGGLATALEELSTAGGHRLRVDMERIPIYPETDKLCGLLKLNPLGLIGSGSLIICCRQYAGDILVEELRRSAIPVAVIGEVREPGTGIEAYRHRRPMAWPSFEADEITRLF
jgi:hydrogenase expression/formation protein HypE